MTREAEFNNPDVAAELATFSDVEKDRCRAAYKLYIEDGFAPPEATRHAVALVMQEQRMNGMRPTDKQYREMFFWEKEYQKTLSAEEAEQKAWQRVMRKGK